MLTLKCPLVARRDRRAAFLLKLTILLPLVLTVSAAFARPAKWTPVSPAELAATDSPSVPGSDFEVIFNHQRLDSDSLNTWIDHHIQAKIYTEAGVERSTIFSIEYDKHYKIWGVAARVVRSDGSSVELTKADFRESSAMKGNGWEIKRTAFAFPNLRPGDVVEYQWSQSVPDSYFNYLTTFCQHAGAATREYVFEVVNSRTDFNVSWFNCASVEYKKGSKRMVIRNLPPFVEEPMMPPQTEFRSWLLLVFSHPYLRFYENEAAWKAIGDYLAEDFRLVTKPSPALKSKAAQLVNGATTPEQQLERLADFCQAEITNLEWADKASVVDAKKKRDSEDAEQSPAKTLDRKSGYAADINVLFAALARAAGFDVRLALSGDREEILNINTSRGWILAGRRSVAVKIGDRWKFYSPGQYLIPPGLLGPKDQGAMAFVCDEKKSWFDTMQISNSERSQTRNVGHFTLDSEGTLEGQVEVQLTGQRAVQAKKRWWESSKEDIVTNIRDDVVERLPSAEVSEVTFENVQNRTLPVTLRYHVRVQGYAEQLGSRLALTLNFFKAGTKEVLAAQVRHYPIFLPFSEQEHDEFDLILPEGFVLDGGSSPAPAGQIADPIGAEYQLKYFSKSRKLMYVSDRTLGKGGSIAFRAESYAAVQQLLGKVYRSDTHQMVLKPKPEATPAALPAAPVAPSSP